MYNINRPLSFFIVFMVYALASAVGIVIYFFFPFHFAINLLIADIVATVFTFIFSLIFKNASVYDPYWSVQPIVILVAFAFYHTLSTPAILALIAVCIWGARLTANWAYTFKGLNHQDWRYTMLKEKTGKWYFIINLVGIHLVPTLIVYACTLPAVYLIIYPAQANAGSYIFFTLSCFAFTLQGISDIQMHAYRLNRTTPFIRTGLWKYSRHPNYLGEILMWWGISLSLLVVNISLWYVCFGALLNTLLFLFVSIPMADNRQSSKEGFAEYKSQTRMLLPIKK
ncbi:MAG: DUF1295 domain-containing protein [Clostridia bacterium]|nr:DUF1295 domain-containing protein [Clostridia bacterium]